MGDDQIVASRCQVLVWPAHVGAIEGSDTSELIVLAPETSGWVIGWNDHASDVDTVICAGIISSQEIQDASTISSNEASPKPLSMESEHSYIDKIIRQLHERWSGACKTRTEKCSCPVCICYQSLCILGRWETTNTYRANAAEDDTLDSQKEGGLRHYFYLTSQGPWVSVSMGHCVTPDSLTQQQQQQQLLIFDNFHAEKGNHYSIASSFDLESLANSMHDRLVLRMSQSDDVFVQLQRLLTTCENPGDTHQPGQEVPKASEVQRCEAHIQSPSDCTGKQSLRECSPGLHALQLWATLCSLSAVHYAALHSHSSHWSSMLPLYRALVAAKSKKMTFVTRQEEVQHKIVTLNSLLTALIDGILGLLLGSAILYEQKLFASTCYQLWSAFHHQLFKANIGWLETFPVGFKLNLALTKNMGYEILALVEIHEKLFSLVPLSSLDGSWIMTNVTGFVSLTFGISGFIAFMFDATRLSTLHVALFASAFRCFYRAELGLLAALWRLCRGKKQNYLRHRTDTMEYDTTQLLLGMILFSTVVFLFTTMFVYYLFFALLDVFLNMIILIMWVIYAFNLNFPYGSCLLRTMRPGWFASNVFIEKMSLVTGGDEELPNRVATIMISVSTTLPNIIWESLFPCLAVCSSIFPTIFEHAVVGKRSTVVNQCLRSKLAVNQLR